MNMETCGVAPRVGVDVLQVIQIEALSMGKVSPSRQESLLPLILSGNLGNEVYRSTPA